MLDGILLVAGAAWIFFLFNDDVVPSWLEWLYPEWLVRLLLPD